MATKPFLSEFFPLCNDPPWHETIRRRTIRVGAGLERESLSRAKTRRTVPPSDTMTVSIDAGHVRTARGHQGRTFEVMAAQVSNGTGTVFHVLDWFHLAMRVQHAARCASGWPNATVRDR